MLEKRKLKYKKDEYLVHSLGHSAGVWWSQALHPGSLALEFECPATALVPLVILYSDFINHYVKI